MTNVIKDTNGHYPIYISSNPIWTDIGVIGPVPRNGIALPHELFINHTSEYTTTLTAQIDILRAQVSAHEFFHAVQWTYVPGMCPLGGQLCTWQTHPDVKWWMEATARWAEPKVYPQNGTYPGQVDDLLANPYRSMPSTDGYSSAIFARYLESKVAAGAPDIIKKVWDQYGTHSNAGMISAIDDVLKTPAYSSTLATEFPKFTWNNYFMITGTYDVQVTGVYTDLVKLTPVFTGPEWQLFRSRLRNGRENYQSGNASVFVRRVTQYPNITTYFQNPQVGRWGASYIEFFPPLGRVTDLNLTLNIRKVLGEPNPKVSVIPMADFFAHPQNNFINPVVDNGINLLYDYTYSNFHQLNRIVVIISNGCAPIDYSYNARITIH